MNPKIPPRRIIVVGAGPGGLLAAVALHQLGVPALVLEQRPAPANLGFAVQIPPNAANVLKNLNLLKRLNSLAYAPTHIHIRSHTNKHVASLPLPPPYLHVLRSALEKVLLDALPSPPQFNSRVVHVANHPESPHVILRNGDVLHADAVVLADGASSYFAQSLFNAPPLQQPNMTLQRGVVLNPPHNTPLEPIVWTAHRRHIVAYRVPSQNHKSVVNVVAAVAKNSPHFNNPNIAFRSFHNAPQKLLALSKPSPWPLLLRRVPKPWARSRVALLGDAAHPMHPCIAQGAAMALEDASSIAQHIAQNPQNIPQALLSYSKQRYPRAKYAQNASKRAAMFYHLPQPLAAPARILLRTLLAAKLNPVSRFHKYTPQITQ